MKRVLCSQDEEYLNWRKRMINNPTFQEMSNICDEHGYRLVSAYEIHPDKFEINIQSQHVDQANIYYNSSSNEYMLELPDGHVGMYNIEEYSNAVTLMKDGADLVRDLKKIDLYGLEKGYNI